MIDFIVETLKNRAQCISEIADEYRANAAQYYLDGAPYTLEQAALASAREYDAESAKLYDAAKWLEAFKDGE